MRISHLLSSIFFVSVASIASAQTTFMVGGIAIGDTKEVALKLAPSAQCYVHFNGKVIDHEICDGVSDPIFSSVGVKASVHIAEGKVSFFTVLLPENKIREVIQMLSQKLGQYEVVVSPSSKDKTKPTPALIWQPKGASVLLDFEKKANGEFGLIVAPPRAIR